MKSRISADEDEQEVGREVRVRRGKVAADGQHREEGDEGDDRERVQPCEEDERDHGVAVGRVLARRGCIPRAPGSRRRRQGR